ncbi:RNA 3'-terminal phosphate cyclase [Candidatus Woesearchaeota archaeon]|nr:RNA 3'-terminal phosphate cyclase [Candidatus Woesearchaeota archaeon]
MISIDGGYLEGGGQIVRTALALSSLTQQPFEAENIRKGRPNPGLKAQHLSCIRAFEELAGAKSQYATLASDKLQFFPAPVKGRTMSIDIGTAGSVTLLLQSLLMPAIFADSKVRLKITGGTDVPWSPPADYFANVLLPHLSNFCEKIEFKLLRRGYYPKGGGKAELIVKPKYRLSDFGSFNEFRAYLNEAAPKISLSSQNALAYVKGVSHASADLQKFEVAERQARSAKSLLELPNVSIRSEYSESFSPGSGIVLWAVFSDNDEVSAENPVILGADALGEKGKRAEKVGAEAANRLLKQIGSKAPVDSYLADQLLPFMALTGKGSIAASEITDHARTNIYLIEKFLGKCFRFDEARRIISLS